MKQNLFVFLGIGLMATACNVDKDADGLTDSEESELGTDPNSADSDQDGINDKDEIDGGTDPLKSDTDGDGCADKVELDASSSPTDAADTVYAGNWPCNPYKESLEDPGWDATAVEDAVLPNWTALDQYGEQVDIYDFANNNFILLDLSGLWCGYCRYMAGWIDQNEQSSDYQTFEQLFGNEEFFTRIPELVDSGELTWITVIDGGNSGPTNPPTEGDLQDWWNDYPNPHVPILLDADHRMQDWVNPNGWPSVTLIGPDRKVLETGSYSRVLEKALLWYDANN